MLWLLFPSFVFTSFCNIANIIEITITTEKNLHVSLIGVWIVLLFFCVQIPNSDFQLEPKLEFAYDFRQIFA